MYLYTSRGGGYFVHKLYWVQASVAAKHPAAERLLTRAYRYQG